ncbi:MAG: alpha/beta hydrolase [Acidobacteria bacterium]|nr:alpha/beta hydrolase [Acidobacteriota bacterium]
MKSLVLISSVSGVSWFGFGFLTAVVLLFLSVVVPVATAQNTGVKKPTIVLVHGAYADGSSWSKVIPMLQAQGFTVVSVQNPLTSLADDVAATNRVIDQQTEPVVLVGHSWAGVVITEAGNNPKVKGLVYISGIAPDSGQSLVDAVAGFPPSAAPVVKDEGGFLSLSESAYMKYFAPDLPLPEQRVLAATQVTWFQGCLTDKVTKAAWRDKPSWWIIGKNDQMVNPKLQEKMAADIKAKVTEVVSSHVVLLTQPKTVTEVIVAASDKIQSGASSKVSVPDVKPDSVGEAETEKNIFDPAPVVPLAAPQAAARLIVDAPLPEALAAGRVVIRYKTENLRIAQVFGRGALDVSPRIGHVHVTVDDAPWHWLDASGEPLTITGLNPGAHKVLIELVNAVHQTLDYQVLKFEVPIRSLVQPDPNADGFRSAPD